MTNQLDFDFDQLMMGLHSRMHLELGHNASVLVRMITDEGGYGAAKALVCASLPSRQFMNLKRLKRLDLSVEAWILRSDHHRFFPLDVKCSAYRRLVESKFKFPADYWDPKCRQMLTSFVTGIAA